MALVELGGIQSNWLAGTLTIFQAAVQLTASCSYQRTEQLTIPRCNRSAHRSPRGFYPAFLKLTHIPKPPKSCGRNAESIGLAL